MPLIYLVAGEQSGDVLGGRLMAALRARRPDLAFGGIGGGFMRAQGLRSLFPLEELALMGFVEVLPRLRLLRRRLAETVADIAARRPDVLVTIDSPGFALRLLRAVAPLGIKRVHYVAPQVWAWRESRVRRYPGLWDRLLCLLPFEPEFFARHGLPATFVGHPVLESGADAGDPARFRTAHGLPPSARIVTIMPGSRRTEIARLLPILGETLHRLSGPAIVPAVPLAGPVADTVRTAAQSWPVRPLLISERQDKNDAFAASIAALTKSGTSTLELALAGVPMLVTYRVNPVSGAILRRLATVRYAALVNLLHSGWGREAGPPLVPELLQDECKPEILSRALAALLEDRSAAAAQRAGFREVLAKLRPPGGSTPSQAAAEAVLDLLEQPWGTHPPARCFDRCLYAKSGRQGSAARRGIDRHGGSIQHGGDKGGLLGLQGVVLLPGRRFRSKARQATNRLAPATCHHAQPTGGEIDGDAASRAENPHPPLYARRHPAGADCRHGAGGEA